MLISAAAPRLHLRFLRALYELIQIRTLQADQKTLRASFLGRPVRLIEAAELGGGTFILRPQRPHLYGKFVLPSEADIVTDGRHAQKCQNRK